MHAYTSLLTLGVAPDRVDAVVARYKELLVIEMAIEHAGAISGELSCRRADGQILVIAHWPSAQAYQTWLDHPIRAQISGQMRDLVTVAYGEVFEVEFRVTEKTQDE